MPDTDKRKKVREEAPERVITIKGKQIPISSFISLALGLAAYIMAKIMAGIVAGSTVTINVTEDMLLFMLRFLGLSLASMAPIIFIVGAMIAVAGLFFKSRILKIGQVVLIVVDFLLLVTIFMFNT